MVWEVDRWWKRAVVRDQATESGEIVRLWTGNHLWLARHEIKGSVEISSKYDIFIVRAIHLEIANKTKTRRLLAVFSPLFLQGTIPIGRQEEPAAAAEPAEEGAMEMWKFPSIGNFHISMLEIEGHGNVTISTCTSWKLDNFHVGNSQPWKYENFPELEIW